MRPYQAESDYWRIRGFLRGVSLLNDRRDYAWSLLRLMGNWPPSAPSGSTM
jgi:hypothetical protein